MPFKKGQSGNPNGREVGKQNKLTISVKKAFEDAFNELQADPKVKLSEWAKSNPDEFYRLATKLIPNAVALSGDQENPVRFTIEK